MPVSQSLSAATHPLESVARSGSHATIHRLPAALAHPPVERRGIATAEYGSLRLVDLNTERRPVRGVRRLLLAALLTGVYALTFAIAWILVTGAA